MGKKCGQEEGDSGQEYVSDKGKRVVAGKTVGPACNCPKKCFDRAGVDNVKCIFDEYRNIKELVLIMKLTVSSQYKGRESILTHNKYYLLT